MIMVYLRYPLYLFIALITITACSGGSGGGGSERFTSSADDSNSNNFVYAGPAPESTDVQSFKISFYDNLVMEQRCGQCHITGGEASDFLFVDREDVNLAWQATKTRVNLLEPANSVLVNKVADGHQCWLGLEQAATCAATITGYVESWAQGISPGVRTVDLLPRTAYSPAGAKIFPADMLTAEALGIVLGSSGELLQLLQIYCADCHASTALVPQAPFFSSAEEDLAYQALRGKIDLSVPSESRLVKRLAQDSHNCWSDCADDAAVMRDAVDRFAQLVPVISVDPNLQISRAQNIEADGIIASSGGRYEDDIIAKWEFREGIGASVADTSGVQPEIPLSLFGEFEWMGGWGVRFSGGKAQGGVAASSKLRTLVTTSGEYSIEAWISPNNVAQEDAWIVGYSGGVMSRNFLLTQTLYNYLAYNRSAVTSDNGAGEPAVSTDDDSEFAQATLQHVVVTFDPIAGRRIYVNGIDAGVMDAAGGGLLNGWNESFTLTLGNSVGLDRPWSGAIRMVAIHNRKMTQEQVLQNYDVGIGQKYFLLFSIAENLDRPANCHVITGDGSRTNYCYVGFEVKEFDEGSYLFNQPFFINLNPEPQPLSFELEGIWLGINGQLAAVGQGFLNVRAMIDSENFAEFGQQLSSMGTTIPKQGGVVGDEFFLAFDNIDGQLDQTDDDVIETFNYNLIGESTSDITLRTFDAINQSFASITGISSASSSISAVTGKSVAQTAAELRRQLPTVADFQAYMSSHHMAVTQLAAAYCDALLQEPTLRNTIFPGFDFDTSASDSALNWSNDVVDPLVDRALNTNLNGAEPGMTAIAGIKAELMSLISESFDLKPYVFNGVDYVSAPDGRPDGLIYCNDGCASSSVVKGACTAVLASGAVLVN